MIVLVLSTPRSGSHYYSESLRKLYPNSVVLHEVLSRAVQGIYLQQQGTIELSSKQYQHDSYYEDLVDHKLVRVFAPRSDLDTFFNKLVNNAANSNQTYILHEHASLLPEYWIEKLLENSNKAVYLTRDHKEQLASRLIAGYTGVYMIRDNYMLCHGDGKNRDQYCCEKFSESIASRELVEQLLHIYTTTDQIMAELKVPCVQYESLHYPDTDIKKLFVSSYARLCDEDQSLIDSILNCGL
jgi:hypothetical protein